MKFKAIPSEKKFHFTQTPINFFVHDRLKFQKRKCIKMNAQRVSAIVCSIKNSCKATDRKYISYLSTISIHVESKNWSTIA